MTAKAIFWIAMAVLVLVIVPIGMALSAWQHMTAKKRGQPPKSSGGGIGNALQELDRLVTRPAIEYTIEAETPILKRDDDQGGK
jgi:hypothetical protein